MINGVAPNEIRGCQRQQETDSAFAQSKMNLPAANCRQKMNFTRWRNFLSQRAGYDILIDGDRHPRPELSLRAEARDKHWSCFRESFSHRTETRSVKISYQEQSTINLKFWYRFIFY